MFLWLKKGFEQKLDELKANGLVGKDLGVTLDRLSGKGYIYVSHDISDPTTEKIPYELAKIVERVSDKIRIERGLRTEGLYRREGATLVVKTDRASGIDGRLSSWQWLDVSGPTLESVWAIYTLVRQGKLEPAENWEASKVVPAPTTHPDPNEDEEQMLQTESSPTTGIMIAMRSASNKDV